MSGEELAQSTAADKAKILFEAVRLNRADVVQAIVTGDQGSIPGTTNGDTASCFGLLDTHDDNGSYPLHVAVRENNLDAMRMLLKLGSDARRKNSENLTAVEMSFKNGSQDSSGVFLMEAIQCMSNGDAHRLSQLIDAGIPPTAVGVSGKSLIEWATHLQCDESIVSLLQTAQEPVHAEVLEDAYQIDDSEDARMMEPTQSSPARALLPEEITCIDIADVRAHIESLVLQRLELQPQLEMNGIMSKLRRVRGRIDSALNLRAELEHTNTQEMMKRSMTEARVARLQRQLGCGSVFAKDFSGTSHVEGNSPPRENLAKRKIEERAALYAELRQLEGSLDEEVAAMMCLIEGRTVEVVDHIVSLEHECKARESAVARMEAAILGHKVARESMEILEQKLKNKLETMSGTSCTSTTNTAATLPSTPATSESGRSVEENPVVIVNLEPAQTHVQEEVVVSPNSMSTAVPQVEVGESHSTFVLSEYDGATLKEVLSDQYESTGSGVFGWVFGRRNVSTLYSDSPLLLA